MESNNILDFSKSKEEEIFIDAYSFDNSKIKILIPVKRTIILSLEGDRMIGYEWFVHNHCLNNKNVVFENLDSNKSTKDYVKFENQSEKHVQSGCFHFKFYARNECETMISFKCEYNFHHTYTYDLNIQAINCDS